MSVVREFSCADLLKALADETRLEVVKQLMPGPKHVGEINQVLDVEQTLLSHHLRVLKEAGIVESCRDGKAVLYQISPIVRIKKRGNAIDFGCCRLSFDE